MAYTIKSFKFVIYYRNDSGQYYKTTITIVSFAPNLALALPSIVNDDRKWCHNLESHLTDNARSIIYDRNVFIIQATGVTKLLAVKN